MSWFPIPSLYTSSSSFLVSLSLASLPLCPLVSQASGQKPNYIVIICDDLGYADVGFNGSKEIRTPHIDRIAREGVRFESAYVTYSVSSPSRAGLMTGRYPQRFGYERNPLYSPDELGMGLPLDERTVAESLREVGYRSGIIGKWHLGAHRQNHPCKRGFDEFTATSAAGIFTSRTSSRSPIAIRYTMSRIATAPTSCAIMSM